MNKIRKNLPIKCFLIFFLIFLNFIVFTQINQVGQNIQKNKTPKITSDNTEKIDQNIFNFSLDEWNLSKNNVKFVHSEIEIKESLKDTSNLESKDAYAIIIGISNYPGSNYDLSFCDDDALGIYSMLVEDFNFERKNVIYLQDSNATKTNIDNAFNDIASQIDENDIFFFYYSGHGGACVEDGGNFSVSINSPHPYDNGYDHTWSIYHEDAAYMRVHFSEIQTEYYYDYILLGDTDIADLWYYEEYSGSHTDIWSGWIPLMSDNKIYIRMRTDPYDTTGWGFEIDEYEVKTYNGTQYLCSYDSIPSSPENYYIDTLINTNLESLNCSEQYIILDCCYSGGVIPEIQKSGRYIMTASGSEESSLESGYLGHGVFTNFFLESFNESSDSNADGVVSMEECYESTYVNTLSYSESLGYTHHPQEYDGILGQNIIYPSIGSFNYDITENNLTYEFNMYGTGLIENIELILTIETDSIDSESVDLTSSTDSPTGFGLYSGEIKFNYDFNLTGIGIFTSINGNQKIDLNKIESRDSDLDGIVDIYEVINNMNPNIIDSYFDGLNDTVEFYGDTDPTNPDTDGDGLLDGEEVNIYKTNATNIDTDGDSMDDKYEVDNDLNPNYNDAYSDLDNDGLSNLLEYQLGSKANDRDSDDDKMPDKYEYENDLKIIVDDASEDPDADDLENYEEYLIGTDPQDYDTDDDSFSDGVEILWNTDPLNSRISPLSIILNITGIITLITISFVLLAYYRNKNAEIKSRLSNKLKISSDQEHYNSFSIKKSELRDPYTKYPRNYNFSYNKVSDPYKIKRTFRSIEDIKDFIRYNLPPPKSAYTFEGQKAMFIAQQGIKLLEEGRTQEAIKCMVDSLILGVPEPINSRLRALFLDIPEIDRNYNEFLSSSNPNQKEKKTRKYCTECGSPNKSKNRYCTNCGGEL